MQYLAYSLIIFSIFNILLGLVLHFRKEIAIRQRKYGYYSVLVQLPLICLVLIFGEDISGVLKLVAVALFFIGYYLVSRPTFVKFKSQE